MGKIHRYRLTVNWTGNKGHGTAHYRAYDRSHTIVAPGKPVIAASSDPAFRGDHTKYNPEELLVAALSGCHMLWFLHLCADRDIVVTEYQDYPIGIMSETVGSGGRFQEVTLHPHVKITDPLKHDQLDTIHQLANAHCFIANSVNFPVHHKPMIVDRNEGFVIRPATNADIPAVKRIVFDTLIEYGLVPDEYGKDNDLNDLAEQYFARNGFFGVLIDTATDRPIGTFGISATDKDTCELRKLFLLKAYRGRGLGEYMFMQALQVAKSKAYGRMILETVAPLKEAIGLYEKHGFQKIPPKEVTGRVDQGYELDL